MEQPKMSTNLEEIIRETLEVTGRAAAAREKTKVITVYPSQPYRSAVVTAVVTCDDAMAKEIAAAFNESVAYVFLQHSQRDKAN
jgi:hypothetical protein